MHFDIGSFIVGLIAVIVVIAVLWWILSRLYQRSTTELSFVRTGFGDGQGTTAPVPAGARTA